MAAPYNYPNDTLSFTGIVQYLNNDILVYNGTGILGTAILGIIFFIMMTATLSKTNDPLLSTSISGMLCFVVSVLMVYIGLAASAMTWLFLLVTMTSVAVMYYRGGR